MAFYTPFCILFLWFVESGCKIGQAPPAQSNQRSSTQFRRDEHTTVPGQGSFKLVSIDCSYKQSFRSLSFDSKSLPGRWTCYVANRAHMFLVHLQIVFDNLNLCEIVLILSGSVDPGNTTVGNTPQLEWRGRWTYIGRAIVVRDLAILKDEGVPRFQWKLKWVVAVHCGSDGIVRVVMVYLHWTTPYFRKAGAVTNSWRIS